MGRCPACGCCDTDTVACHNCGGLGYTLDYGECPFCDTAGTFRVCRGRCDPRGRHWSLRYWLRRILRR